MSFPSLGIEILTPQGSIAKLVVPPHVSIRPVGIGTDAEVEVQGEGIAPEHLFILLREGRLLASSAISESDPFARARGKPMKPAMLATASTRTILACSWTPLDLPCRVELGDVTVRLFWCSSRRIITPPPTQATEFGEIPTRRRTPTPPAFVPPTKAPRAVLPPLRPPPKRPLPLKETPIDRALREAALLREDDTTAARPEGGDHDHDPDHEPTFKNGSDDLDVPTPPRQKRPRLMTESEPTWVKPLSAPHMKTPIPARPPSATASESKLLKMATRAVDAWNRFVEDVDKPAR